MDESTAFQNWKKAFFQNINEILGKIFQTDKTFSSQNMLKRTYGWNVSSSQWWTTPRSCTTEDFQFLLQTDTWMCYRLFLNLVIKIRNFAIRARVCFFFLWWCCNRVWGGSVNAVNFHQQCPFQYMMWWKLRDSVHSKISKDPAVFNTFIRSRISVD